jgi:hypothetical protein
MRKLALGALFFVWLICMTAGLGALHHYVDARIHDQIVEPAIEEPTDMNLEIADRHYLMWHGKHFTLD